MAEDNKQAPLRGRAETAGPVPVVRKTRSKSAMTPSSGALEDKEASTFTRFGGCLRDCLSFV